jgi:hypothetical protein
MTSRRAVPVPASVGTLPRGVQAYVGDVAAAAEAVRLPVASIIVFGSTVAGGFEAGTSDVDLIVVEPDGRTRAERQRLRDAVQRVEVEHGFGGDGQRKRTTLEAAAAKLTGNASSYFICSHSDLLSGRVHRILGISRLQAAFVDRAVIPAILASAATVHGADLLPHVPLQPLRRMDALKALHGFTAQLLLAAALFPFLPQATYYAMGAVKRSLHNCYFSRHGRLAGLEQEIAYFSAVHGPSPVLARLVELRRDYRPDLGFILRALPLLVRLHVSTAARDMRAACGPGTSANQRSTP